MNFAMLCLNLFLSILVSALFIGCGDTEKPRSQNQFSKDLTGYWVDEDEPILEGDINGFHISSNGEVTDLSAFADQEVYSANITDSGEVLLNKSSIVKLNKSMSDFQFENVKIKLEKVKSDKIRRRILSATIHGEEKPFEKPIVDTLIRLSKNKVEDIKKDVLKISAESDELLATLVGTRWELVEVLRLPDETNQGGETIAASDVESHFESMNQLTREEITIYNFKDIKFVDDKTLEINSGDFKTEFELRSFLLRAHFDKPNNGHLTNVGMIDIVGESLTITSEARFSSLDLDEDGDQFINQHRANSKFIYKRVE